MSWRAFICDTRTGTVKNPIRLSSATWGRHLNAHASGQAALPLLAKANKDLDLDDLLDPIRNTLVLDWDGTIVYAGLLQESTDVLNNMTVTFPHADLWWFFSKRLAIDFNADHSEKSQEVYTSLDLGTIAKRRVQLATTGGNSRNLDLPITYPADATGSVSRTFYGYDLHVLADELTDIVNEGPDIDFQPRWVDGKLDWLMRVGSAAAPDLTGGPWEWNASASKPTIFDVTRTTSGEKLANAAYVVGEGSEVDMMVRSSPDFTSPYPAMQNVDTHKDIHDVNKAIALAQANIDAFKRPTVQWAASIMVDGNPVDGTATGATVADLVPGGTAKIWTQGHPRIPDGSHTQRLIGYSGDITSRKVGLQMQPGRN